MSCWFEYQFQVTEVSQPHFSPLVHYMHYLTEEDEDAYKKQFSPMYKIVTEGNSLVVQWLGLCNFTARAWFDPRWGTKNPSW